MKTILFKNGKKHKITDVLAELLNTAMSRTDIDNNWVALTVNEKFDNSFKTY